MDTRPPPCSPAPPSRRRLAQRLGLAAGRVHTSSTSAARSTTSTNALLYCAAHLPDPRNAGYEAALHDELERPDHARRAAARSPCSPAAGRWTRRPTPCGRASDVRCSPSATSRSRRWSSAFADDEAASLFATMGFWQGIDVPGPHAVARHHRPAPVPPPRRPAAPGQAGAGQGRRLPADRPPPRRDAARPGRRPADPLHRRPRRRGRPRPRLAKAELPLGRGAGPAAHARTRDRQVAEQFLRSLHATDAPPVVVAAPPFSTQ